VDRALHRSAEHTSQFRLALQIHNIPWTSTRSTAQRYIIARGGPEFSSQSAAHPEVHLRLRPTKLLVTAVTRASSGSSSLAADRAPLHHTTALLSDCSQHRWGRPSDTHKHTHTHTHNYTATYISPYSMILDVNKYCYWYVNYLSNYNTLDSLLSASVQ
jgi:hypothetical protein